MVDGTLIGEGTDIAKGSVDMSLARELGYEFKDFFTPDILLDEKDDYISKAQEEIENMKSK